MIATVYINIREISDHDKMTELGFFKAKLNHCVRISHVYNSQA